MTTPAIYRQFRHILCPVDFSIYSRAALRYALTLALRNQSRLTVLFVNDPLLGAAAVASSRFGPRQRSITYRILSRAVAPILAIPERRR